MLTGGKREMIEIKRNQEPATLEEAKLGIPGAKAGVCALFYRLNAKAEVSILLGLRKGSHSAGQWALPGGRIEAYEHPKQTVQREVLEEVGVGIANPIYLGLSVCTIEGQTWVTLNYMKAEPCSLGQRPILLEPEKCERWDWFPFAGEVQFPESAFPYRLFLPTELFLSHLGPNALAL